MFLDTPKSGRDSSWKGKKVVFTTAPERADKEKSIIFIIIPIVLDYTKIESIVDKPLSVGLRWRKSSSHQLFHSLQREWSALKLRMQGGGPRLFVVISERRRVKGLRLEVDGRIVLHGQMVSRKKVFQEFLGPG